MKTYGLEEAAAFLNISPDTLKDFAGSGVVPGAKIGKCWVFSDESLEQYLRDEIVRQTNERRGIKSAPPEEKKQPPMTAYARTVRRGRAAPPLLSGVAA